MNTFDTPCRDPAVSGHATDNLEMICCHALTPKSEINNVFSQILHYTEIIIVYLHFQSKPLVNLWIFATVHSLMNEKFD